MDDELQTPAVEPMSVVTSTTHGAEIGWAMLADSERGSVREIARWGMTVGLSRTPEFTGADTIPFQLQNEQKIMVSGTARVVSLVEYEIGCDALLWVIDHDGRWEDVAKSLSNRLRHRPRDSNDLGSSRLSMERFIPRLRSLANNHAKAMVSSADSDVSVPARLDPERGLMLEWSPNLSDLKAPFKIQVEGPFSTVNFVDDTLRWNDGASAHSASLNLRRRLRRVPAPSGAKVVVFSDDGTPIELRMKDVSFGGVSARIPSDLDHLRVDQKLSDVILTWRGGPQLRFSGEVRHRSLAPAGDSDLVGLKLEQSRDPQWDRWAREVESLLYPTTESFGHDYQSIWDLFEASGYFDLSDGRRESTGFQELRSAFENAYGRLATAPDLGCLAAFSSPTRAEATLAGLRLWSSTWIGFQLARNQVRPHLSKSDSTPLRDLFYHVYERAGADPDLRWLIAFIRDDAPRFSKVLHRDFVLASPGGCAVPFQAWKSNVHMLGEGSMLNTEYATEEQTQEVLRKLAKLRPHFYLDAHDLLPETFAMQKLKDDWEFYGMLRDRTMVVATERGRIVAAAVLDAAENGLHLYSLLDTVRLYELEPGGSRHYGELLDRANEWFYGYGKNSFVTFGEDLDPSTMQSLGATGMGDGLVTYLPSTSIPYILERVSELTAPK
ncbi:MAG: PilZ domain-containing protein [Myxococcota bacterium]